MKITFIIALVFAMFAKVAGGAELPPIAKVGERITTILPAPYSARLCPEVDCAQDAEIGRIPPETVLTVLEIYTEDVGSWDVVWYRVGYHGRFGWVGENGTDRAPRWSNGTFCPRNPHGKPVTWGAPGTRHCWKGK